MQTSPIVTAIKEQVVENQKVIDELNEKLHRRTNEVKIIQTISSEILNSLNLEDIFGKTMELMDEVFGFRHAMILIKKDNEDALRVVASRGYEDDGWGAEVKFGQGAIGVVAKKRRILRMLGMGQQIRYQRMSMGLNAEQSNNVSLPGLKDVESQIAIPLLVKDKLIGVFAVESNDRSAFNAVDEVILNVVANQIAVAIDNASAYRTQKLLTEAYSKFVPKQFLALLNKESILDTKLDDQIQGVFTILFSDIRGFTTLSEKMSPQENFEFINRYLSFQAPVIEKNNGFIDKYIGDAIMAIFPESPCDAVAAANEMVEQLALFNDQQTFKGKATIDIGIGVHTGMIMAGIVGSKERWEGTVIGDAVNVASRVEGLTKEYGCRIVATAATVNCLPFEQRSTYSSLGLVSVKGKEREIKAYKVG